jgi:Ca-activated chloride channel family protein
LKLRVAILFLVVAAYSVAQQEQLTRILFVFDASNSMNQKWGRETRIEIAKKTLIRSVDSLRGIPNLEIGLRVYGHQSPITATYQDCEDTKLEAPFATDNHDFIINKIKAIRAKGTTPIARSLEAAAGDFPDRNSRNIIILITDGIEACDDEPCVIADKLRAKGISISPFVIGLGMDMSYLNHFDCYGNYKSAETEEEFKAVLKNVINIAMVNTSVQINLNTIHKKPLETDVTMFLYEAGTNNLLYTFTHTLNEKGLPDTLIIDPNKKYDLIVNTLPRREKRNITIKK